MYSMTIQKINTTLYFFQTNNIKLKKSASGLVYCAFEPPV